MKRIILSILVVLITITTLLLASCGGDAATTTSTCTHLWNEANCTTPKTCSMCGVQEGTPLDHQWKNATCSAPKTCERCNQTEGEVADHNYVNNICTMCQQKSPVAIQLEKGQKVFDNLVVVALITGDMSDRILDAWHFSIYEADKKEYLLNVDKLITDFASETGLKKDEVIKAIDTYVKSLGFTDDDIDDTMRATVLKNFEYAVPTVAVLFKNVGTISEMDGYMEEAKKLLDEMSSDYESQTEYTRLKEFYATVKAFYACAKSPSGSYNNFSSTVNAYSDDIINLINLLGFVYSNE